MYEGTHQSVLRYTLSSEQVLWLLSLFCMEHRWVLPSPLLKLLIQVPGTRIFSEYMVIADIYIYTPSNSLLFISDMELSEHWLISMTVWCPVVARTTRLQRPGKNVLYEDYILIFWFSGVSEYFIFFVCPVSFHYVKNFASLSILMIITLVRITLVRISCLLLYNIHV